MPKILEEEKPATLEDLCAKTKHGEPAIFELGGKRFAIVTDEDLELFQTLEDRMDIDCIEERKKEIETDPAALLPFE